MVRNEVLLWIDLAFWLVFVGHFLAVQVQPTARVSVQAATFTGGTVDHRMVGVRTVGGMLFYTTATPTYGLDISKRGISMTNGQWSTTEAHVQS